MAGTGYGDQVNDPIIGVYYGGIKVGGHQLGIQLVGIAFSIGWSFILTYAILQIIDKTIGLRVSEEDEIQGKYMYIHKNMYIYLQLTFRYTLMNIYVHVLFINMII